MRIAAVLVLLATACTRHVALGEHCEKAEQCGNGSDCYRGVCTPLCADDSECDGQLVCARHRCLMATGEPRTAEDRLPTANDRRPNTDDRLPTTDDRQPNPASRLPPTDTRPPITEGQRPGFRGPASQPPVDVAKELQVIHEQLDALRQEQERQKNDIETLRAKHR